jgi:hypothetical protein
MSAYFIVIWNVLLPFGNFFWPFGKVVVIWYSFPRFGTYIVARKIWQPCCQSLTSNRIFAIKTSNDFDRKPVVVHSLPTKHRTTLIENTPPCEKSQLLSKFALCSKPKLYLQVKCFVVLSVGYYTYPPSSQNTLYL